MGTNLAGEPIDTARDLVALAARGMAFAVSVGTACVALVLWGVQQILAGAPPSERPVAAGPAPLLLLTGTVAALLLSGFAAWRRLAPIYSYYRRGALALVSAFGTFVVALLAAPLNHYLGRWSLLGLAAVAGAAALLLSRNPARPRETG
ncbi:MAG: hypothetical protein ACREMX_11420 [Gemmatimonadales bacterium]